MTHCLWVAEYVNQPEDIYTWLQAQIKPHFIFNTLNTIASLSTVDLEKMTRLLNEFGTQKTKSSGIGIVNTNRRLEKLFGEGLTVKSREGHGTTVSMTIPSKSIGDGKE